MAILKEGYSDPEIFFNLNGLDYEKNFWEIIYSDREITEGGGINEDKLKIGLKRIDGSEKVIQSPINYFHWKDKDSIPYSSLNELLNAMIKLVGFDLVSSQQEEGDVPTLQDVNESGNRTSIGMIVYNSTSQSAYNADRISYTNETDTYILLYPSQSGTLALTSDLDPIKADVEELENTRLESIVQGTNVTVDNTDPLNPVVSAIGGQTAEVVNRSYFTADEETTALGTFYIASREGKGTEPEAIQAVTLGDLEKEYYGQDLLGLTFTEGVTILVGDYTGGSTVFSTSDQGQYRFTIEIYVADANGNPRDSGVAGQPVGDLGFQVCTILSSGFVGLEARENTQVELTGSINSEYTLDPTERHRFHVSAEKVDSAGANIEVQVRYGTNYDSFIQVPFTATTDNVINTSEVAGATASDALNNTKARIDALKGDDIAYQSEENNFTEDNNYSDGIQDYIRFKKDDRAIVAVNSQGEEIGIVPFLVYDYKDVEGLNVPKGTMIGNGDTLSVATEENSDYPFVTTLGDPEFTTDLFSSTGTEDSTVVGGNRFILSKDIEISGLRFYTSVAGVNSHFTAYLRIYDVTPDDGEIYSFSGIPLVSDSYLELTISPTFGRVGQVVEAYLISTENSTNTTWEWNWTYGGDVTISPVSTYWNINPNGTLFRINYTSLDGYKKPDIDLITVGSYITVTQNSNVANYTKYEVMELRAQNINDTSFVVNLVETGLPLDAEEPCTVHVEIPDAEGTVYDYESGFWGVVGNIPEWASSVEGVLYLNGALQSGQENNAFGADIKAGEVTKSDKWRIIII